MQNLTIPVSAVPETLLGAPKFKVGHLTVTTPNLRVIVILMLGLGIAYMHSSFIYSGI